MKTIIHVNRHFIAQNVNRKDKLPIYTVKKGNKNTYGYGVNILGPSKLIDIRDSKKLSCGARAWIETNAEVEIIGSMTFDDIKKLKKD